MSSFATFDTTGIAILSLVFIVGGYLGVYLLWHFMVLRPSRRGDDGERPEAQAVPSGQHPPRPRH